MILTCTDLQFGPAAFCNALPSCAAASVPGRLRDHTLEGWHSRNFRVEFRNFKLCLLKVFSSLALRFPVPNFQLQTRTRTIRRTTSPTACAAAWCSSLRSFSRLISRFCTWKAWILGRSWPSSVSKDANRTHESSCSLTKISCLSFCTSPAMETEVRNRSNCVDCRKENEMRRNFIRFTNFAWSRSE